MKYSLIKGLLLSLFLELLLTAGHCLAATPGIELDGQDRQWIRDHPVIRLYRSPISFCYSAEGTIRYFCFRCRHLNQPFAQPRITQFCTTKFLFVLQKSLHVLMIER